MKKMLAMSEEFYNEIMETLMNFENATDDDTNPYWMSDGEWLDVFYGLLNRIQDETECIITT